MPIIKKDNRGSTVSQQTNRERVFIQSNKLSKSFNCKSGDRNAPINNNRGHLSIGTRPE